MKLDSIVLILANPLNKEKLVINIQFFFIFPIKKKLLESKKNIFNLIYL